MAGVFANLLKKNVDASTIPTRTEEARKWVQTSATSAMKNARNVIKTAPANLQKGAPANSIIGQMLLFQYQATTAKNLPYWDKYPLVFPFHVDSTGMWGINMHYLPHQMRAVLMDQLLSISSSNMTSPTAKLQLSYNTLQAASRNRYFLPCVKHYLNKGLDSNIVTIPAQEWSIALFLPLERFQKASSSKVHEDSRRIIRKR